MFVITCLHCVPKLPSQRHPESSPCMCHNSPTVDKPCNPKLYGSFGMRRDLKSVSITLRLFTHHHDSFSSHVGYQRHCREGLFVEISTPAAGPFLDAACPS
jgi:hypothetical protein